MRAGIVHNECESVRVSTVSIFGLASDTSWTPIITLSEVSFPSFSMTKCSTHVDPPFPTSLAPFRTFRHAHHVVESLPVHFRAAKSPSKHHRSTIEADCTQFWSYSGRMQLIHLQVRFEGGLITSALTQCGAILCRVSAALITPPSPSSATGTLTGRH